MNNMEHNYTKCVLDLFTRTFNVTTSLIEAMSDTLSDIMCNIDDILDHEIKEQIMYECRYIKKSLRYISARSKKQESNWIQDVRLYHRLLDSDAIIRSCEIVKVEILETSKKLNDLITHCDKAIDYIDQSKKPFKNAKLLVSTLEDEHKAEVYKKYINKRSTDVVKLDSVRRYMITSKRRLQDINKRCISAISKYNGIKDLI